jgi:hypothetical protein
MTGFHDWSFWVSVVAAGYKWFVVKEVLFNYRDRTGSMVKTSDQNRISLTNQIIANNKSFYTNNAESIIAEFVKHRDKLKKENSCLINSSESMKSRMLELQGQTEGLQELLQKSMLTQEILVAEIQALQKEREAIFHSKSWKFTRMFIPLFGKINPAKW